MVTETITLSIPGVMADYSFTREGSILHVRSKTGDGSFSLEGMSRVRFSDGNVAVTSGLSTAVAAVREHDDGSPFIAALSDGGYVLAWESGRGGNESSIQVQRHSADGTLLKATLLPSEEAADPTVTELKDGTFIVAWASESETTDTGYIKIQRFDAQGNQIGSQATIASSASVELDKAVIQVLSNGNYLLSWLEERETRTATADPERDMADGELDGYHSFDTSDLCAQLYKADGTPIGSKQKVFAGQPSRELGDQKILPTADGGFLMVWMTDHSHTGEDGYETITTASFHARLFDASGVPRGSERLLHTVDDAYPYFSMAATASGYVLSWVSEAVNDTGVGNHYARAVQTQHYDAALDKAGSAHTVSAFDYSVNGASVTQLSDGGYLLTWSSFAPFEYVPPVFDDAGNLIEAATQKSVPSVVYAQRFHADGREDGAEIRVATLPETHGILNTPVASALTNGGFMIAWEGYPLETGYSDRDLFAQRFDRDGSPQGEVSTLLGGGDGNDSLTWEGAGPVVLAGGQGDDRLEGGQGNDRLEGGEGHDTAFFSAAQQDYRFRLTPDGELQIDGPDGCDTLHAIENLHFSDTTLQIGAHTLQIDSIGSGERSGCLSPVSATLADGSRILAWISEGDTPGIYLQRYDSQGEPLDTVRLLIPLNESSTRVQSGHASLEADVLEAPFSLTALADGGFVLGWVEQLTAVPRLGQDWGNNGQPLETPWFTALLHTQRFDASGQPVGERSELGATSTPLYTLDRLDRLDSFATAALPDGGYLVTRVKWVPEQEVNGKLVAGTDRSELLLQRFDASGKAIGAPVNIAASGPSAYADAELHAPGIAVLNDGSYVVVVHNSIAEFRNGQGSTDADIWLQRFDARHQKIGSPVKVNQQNSGLQFDAAVTALEQGGFVVSWISEVWKGSPYGGELDYAEMHVQRYSASGVKAGAEARFSVDSDSPKAHQTVTALSGGGYVVVWNEAPANGPWSSLHAQLFDAQGNRLGDSMLIASTPNPVGEHGEDPQGWMQLRPAVSATEDGGFIVSWDSKPVNINGEVIGESSIHAARYDAQGKPLTILRGDAGDNHIVWTGSTGVLLEGGPGNDTLIAGDGNDTLIGGTGSNVLNGGKGQDTAIYAGRQADYEISRLGQGEIQVTHRTSGEQDVLRDIEWLRFDDSRLPIGWMDETITASTSHILPEHIGNLTLTGRAAINGTGNDLDNLLTGNDGNNRLEGGKGADTLKGGRGNDWLDGGEGADTMYGGLGNDTYIVDHEDDQVIEGAGKDIDTVRALISYILTDNVENLILTGSAPINGIGNALNNILTGNDADNRLEGSAGADTLQGGGGNDWLDGGTGVDRLIGGKGDDTHIVDLVVKGKSKGATLALEDTIVEKANEGRDTLQLRIENIETLEAELSAASKVTTLTLTAQLENLDASATGDIDLNLTGNTADNELTGNAGDNILSGAAGNDTLDGGAGNDILIGGLGADTLTGGAGRDTFRFTSVRDSGLAEGSRDVVTDFVSGEDKLDFSALKGWKFVGKSDFTGARQLRYAVEGEGDQVKVILYGNVNTNPEAEFAIELLGIGSLLETDFNF